MLEYTTKLTLLIIANSIMSIYLIFCYRKYGITQSISLTSKELGKHSFMFTLTMWSYALLTVIVADKPLMFFSGAGICFVGATPYFFKDEKIEKTVHMIGAISGVCFATLSVWLDYGRGDLSLIFAGLTIFLFIIIRMKSIYWVELLTMVIVGFVLFRNLHPKI